MSEQIWRCTKCGRGMTAADKPALCDRCGGSMSTAAEIISAFVGSSVAGASKVADEPRKVNFREFT